ncbi:C-type mannose receptor 2 isoform X2 [Anabrus simplex]|uniref:C-type mannose receptor 2 isoform X2 n=1 Tax=Anabrus simplex TaxID=316456 RepID=UPI0035A2F594
MTCYCESTNVFSFSTLHNRNASGLWYSEIDYERRTCSRDDHTDCTPPQTTRRIPPITTDRDEPPAFGYELFPTVGSFYKHHTITRTWEDARYTCEQEGAHLAIINSEEEARTLAEIYKRSPAIRNAFWDFAFIGFHDLYDEGSHVTIFGEPLHTLGFGRIWAHGDFNNLGQNDVYSGEDCGAISRNGGLDDLWCDGLQSFFCEKELEPYPPPSDVDYSAGAFRSLQDEIKPREGTRPRQRPGPGYELFDKVGYYKFHTTGTTWENARHICHLEGGHLAIINSPAEAMILTSIFKRVPHLKMVKNNNFALIGFHDLYVEGDFRTIYGEPLAVQGYNNWRRGAPNNAGKSNIDPGEDCGSISREGLLDDIDCRNNYAFFCEQELVV